MTHNQTVNPNSPEYFEQGDLYWSESQQRFEEIKFMPVPHAHRAMAKLERKHGWDVTSTTLYAALRTRADQGIDAEVTEVRSIDGESKMLRDRRTGRYRGAYRKSAPKERRKQ